MSYICSIPPLKIQGTLVDDGHGNYKGECVSLLKLMCPTLPATSQWEKGDAAKDVAVLAQGTAIATFGKNGKYVGHAAIFVMKTPSGLLVWDQYNHPAKGVGQRTLTFNDKQTTVNNGNKFYVIE